MQDAIHAPHISWSECSSIVSRYYELFPIGSHTHQQDVFVNGTDNSVPVMLSVMPNVIEKSERTVVMHGGIVSILFRNPLTCLIVALGLRTNCRRNKVRAVPRKFLIQPDHLAHVFTESLFSESS